MSRIAIFSTYAPSEGFGGPARTYHQRVVLESAGHEVTHVVLDARSDRGALRPSDLHELVERPYRSAIDHIYNDVDLGRRASDDARLIERLRRHLETRGIETIILEQPFLVGAVEQLANALDVPVIYSCQNIEYRLRQSLERFQPDRTRTARRAEQVRELEQRSVDLSHAITTICPYDQQQLVEEFGAASTLVPNGSSVADIPLGEALVPRGSETRFAYAGSAYWPNIEGFIDIATPSLAFLPPTCRIDVAGTVGGELMRHPEFVRHQSANAARLDLHGFVPMERLVAIMADSDAVIVPVFIGEGSNLKSADALASAAPVIMTGRAVRGYEDIIENDDEGVTIVDSAADFRAAMAAVMRSSKRVQPVGIRRRETLAWASRLLPLIEVVRETVQRPDSTRGRPSSGPVPSHVAGQ